MDAATVGDLLQLALQTTFMISAPLLMVGLAVGFVISIFQAATQVNEVTLVFIPKMLAVGSMMWLLGPWMFEELLALMSEITHHVMLVSSGGL